MAMETQNDSIPAARDSTVTGPKRWFSFCGPPSAKLSLGQQKTLRCTAFLIVVMSIIELGVGGAAYDVLNGKIAGHAVGMWWGASLPLVAGLVASCCWYENRLFNAYAQSVLAAILSFVAAVVEGIGAQSVSQIQAVGQVINSTAAAYYAIHPTTSIQGHHPLKYYGNPQASQLLLECLSAEPSNPTALSFGNDDMPCGTAKFGSMTPPASAVACAASVPKFGTNVCYTWSGYLGGCGSAILHNPPKGLPAVHNCGQIISVLPDVTVGSTVLLSMLCMLSIIQAYHSGKWYYATQARSLASTDDQALFGVAGGKTNVV